MWPGRRRLRRLEQEVAAAKADRAELRRRLELFEMIAAASGASLLDSRTPADSATSGPAPHAVTSGAPINAARLPPELIAAARDTRSQDIPVRLDVAGAEVIAIIGGDGDPREWWTTIARIAQIDETQP